MSEERVNLPPACYSTSVLPISVLPAKHHFPQKAAMSVTKAFLMLVFVGLVVSILAIGRNSAKKVKPVPDSIDNLAAANLTKRPLNLYITANGVHAEVKEFQLDDGLSYTLTKPPFGIKWRTSLIISTKKQQIYTAQRPNLLQMCAAAGLHTFLAINQTSSPMHPVLNFVSKLNPVELGERWVLLIDDTAAPLSEDDLQLASDLGLEAIVFLEIGGGQKVATPLGITKPVLLISDAKITKTTKSSVAGLVNAQKVQLKDDNIDDPEAVMQVLQNFFDLLHPR
uniref:DUF3616 domain-containing protein n=1 Tax=Panagrellus redivivus TaxID=6233 RepID=A0A7E4VHM6_PANRE